jgi:hypothetical protein
MESFDIAINEKILRRMECICDEENLSINDLVNLAIGWCVVSYEETHTSIGKSRGAMLAIVDREGVVYSSFGL